MSVEIQRAVEPKGADRATRLFLFESKDSKSPGVANQIRKVARPKYDVIPCSSLREAEARIREFPCDVGLVDLDSVRQDVKLWQILQRTAPDMPIIAFARTVGEHSWRRAVRIGAHDCFAFSEIDPQLLVRAIRYAQERGSLMTRISESQMTIIESQADAIVIVDPEGVILVTNPAASRLFGCLAEDLIGSNFGFPIVTQDVTEIVINRPNGQASVAEMRVSRIDWKERPAYIASLRDVTDRKEAEEKLREMCVRLDEATTHLESLTRHDPLTDLLNRRGLDEVLVRELGWARRAGWDVVAVLIDLDNFKHINDSFGHNVGDVVLKETARKVREVLRETDYPARVGGDEFLVLLPRTKLAEGARVAEKLRLTISKEPVVLSDYSVPVTASIGVVLLGPRDATIDDVLMELHDALHRSKEAGKNRVTRCEDGELQSGEDSLRVAIQALKDGCFRAVHQPIVALGTGEIVAYELLSRLSCDHFENPDDFFRIALEASLLSSVDRRCLETCLAAILRLPPARFHVNLFPSTLLELPRFLLLETLQRGAVGRPICVEVSEQQIIGEPTYLTEVVSDLRNAGVIIAIDDVGFGRTCLESLILLEPDVVKIDKRCVIGIGQDLSRKRPLERLLRIAASLDTEVIAEGIETEADLAVVRDLGVEYGQGYYWSKPVEIPETPPEPLTGEAIA